MLNPGLEKMPDSWASSDPNIEVKCEFAAASLEPISSGSESVKLSDSEFNQLKKILVRMEIVHKA